jgi:hypothetical protein
MIYQKIRFEILPIPIVMYIIIEIKTNLETFNGFKKEKKK